VVTVPSRPGFFDVDVRARLSALRHARFPGDLFAVRELALLDEDATVRAVAVERLLADEARALRPSIDLVLAEATRDEAPSVRHLAWQGIRRPSSELLRVARLLLGIEPTWWVRRSIVAALERAGDSMALLDALDDPQWRVRHAACRALRHLGAFDEVRALLERSPLHVVRQSCRFVLGESEENEPPRPLPLDDDPAVATQLLEESKRTLAADQLASLLADPHERLRAVAVKRLGDLEPETMARAVLPYLDEPRLAEAVEAARSVLSRLSAHDALGLARNVVDQVEGRGSLGWAMGWLLRGSPQDVSLVTSALDSTGAARRAAAVMTLLEVGETKRAVAALGSLEEVDRLLVEWSLETLEVVPRCEVRSRSLQLLQAMEADEVPAVERFVHESPSLARRAVEWLRLRVPTRPAPDSMDPWLRVPFLSLDALVEETAKGELVAKRLALERLVESRRELTAFTRLEVATRALDEPEAELRALGVQLLTGLTDAQVTAVLLAFDVDVDPGVRSLAAEALEALPNLPARLDPASVNDERARLGLWQWRFRLGLELPGLIAAGGSEAEHEHLRALELAASPHPPEPAPAPTVVAHAGVVPLRLPSWRALGATGVEVSPLILSGANALPVSGFFEAAERGCNTFFWEPDDESTTRFLRSASPACQVVAGSYDSGARRLRDDVERALRRLGRETLDVFLLFWVRSPGRVSAENFDALERLRREGKLRTFGFSTHLREVAADAVSARAWPVVMTRYSLAHPGAERSLLPVLAERNVGTLGFTSTCYGRLLEREGDGEPASADECYRFSLERMNAVIAAPRTVSELEAGLKALTAEPLDPSREAALRRHGEIVRGSSSSLNHLVRQVRSLGKIDR